MTGFEAGLAGGGQRGRRSAGGMAAASFLACFSEAMLCVCNPEYPSGLPLPRSSFPLSRAVPGAPARGLTLSPSACWTGGLKSRTAAQAVSALRGL